MTDILKLISANQQRWDAMHYTTGRLGEIQSAANQLMTHKAQYQEIVKGVAEITSKVFPWVVPAVTDMREHDSSLGLCNSYLGNGQPLNHITTIVPKGRGPFFNHPTDPPLRGAFFRGALDALIDVQKIQSWDDWTPGGTLTFLETLNGLGYANRGMASPYIWGATSEQQRGKYVSDRVFDPTVMDTQLGCAAMIRYMMGLDSTITLPPTVAAPPVPDHPPPLQPPVPIPTPIPVPVPPVPTPEPPMPTTPVVTTPQIDLGALFSQLLPILPVVTSLFPITAPFTPLIQAGVNVVTKSQPTGGIIATPAPTMEKLIADAMYQAAVAMDPTLVKS